MADPIEPVAPISEIAPAVVAAPVETPVEVAAPAAPAAEPAVTLVGDQPSLLELIVNEAPKVVEADKPAAAAKPEEPNTPDAPKPVDAAKPPAEGEKPKTDVVAELLTEAEKRPEYKFEMPKALKEAPKEMGDFTTILGDFKAPVEAGQKLLDLHAKAMEAYAQAYNEQALANQHRVFNEMRTGWREKIRSDPELGGAGFETTSRAVARMRDLLVPESDRKEFEEYLRVTGSGDHPALWRLLHRAARYFDEPAPPPPGARPTKTNGQRAGGASVLYDNPRSNIGGAQ